MATEQELKKINPLHKEFQALLDADFKDRRVKEGEIIKATVTEITPKFIVVDAKLKMESMIPIEEFKNDEILTKLKVGSTIEVFLDRVENFKGEVVISYDKAKKMKAYEAILIQNGKVTEGTSSNIWIIKKNNLMTHPANTDILKGVTRTSLLNIIKQSVDSLNEDSDDEELIKIRNDIFKNLVSSTSYTYASCSVKSILIHGLFCTFFVSSYYSC